MHKVESSSPFSRLSERPLFWGPVVFVKAVLKYSMGKLARGPGWLHLNLSSSPALE